MHEEDYPHLEIPDGIVKVSITKSSKLKALVKRYKQIGFNDYDLIELAQLSLSEWRNRAYPIPKGYRVSWGNYIVKDDLKSNPFVK